MIFPGFGKIIFEGLRPQTIKRRQMMFAGLGKLHGRLEVLNHMWRPEVQNHKRRPNDFSGPWKNHLGGLRRHKMRPNDFCRLWRNHFEGLRPQTTKRGQMVFAGLGKLHGRLEVLNHILRPEAQNQKRRPNDFSGPWKNHLGSLRRHKIAVRTVRFGYSFGGFGSHGSVRLFIFGCCGSGSCGSGSFGSGAVHGLHESAASKGQGRNYLYHPNHKNTTPTVPDVQALMAPSLV